MCTTTSNILVPDIIGRSNNIITTTSSSGYDARLYLGYTSQPTSHLQWNPCMITPIFCLSAIHINIQNHKPDDPHIPYTLCLLLQSALCQLCSSSELLSLYTFALACLVLYLFEAYSILSKSYMIYCETISFSETITQLSQPSIQTHHSSGSNRWAAFDNRFQFVSK